MKQSLHQRFAKSRLYAAPVFLWVMGGLFALIIGQSVLIDAINSKWPPESLNQKAANAVAYEAASLSRLTNPNVLVGFQLAPFKAWLIEEIQSAVAKANAAANDGNRISISGVDISLSGQTVEIHGDFSVLVPSQDVTVSGHLEAAAAISHRGTTLDIAPAVSALRVYRIDGHRTLFWFLDKLAPILSAILTDFRDNINGQIPVYSYSFPISPLLSPGETASPIPVTITNPFNKTQTTIQLVPPTLKGMALLIDQGQLLLLAELSLAPLAELPQIAPIPTEFTDFRRAFVSAATNAGVPIHDGVEFDISPSFVAAFVAQYISPTYTRDRVTQAVQASLEALQGLQHIDVGITLDSAVLLSLANAEITKSISEWKKPDGLSIGATRLDIAPQYFIGAAQASVALPAVGGSADISLILTAPIGTSASGITIFPAIDKVEFSRITSASFGDLTGLIRGINAILAGAVSAFNGYIPTYPIDIPTAKFQPYDLANAASGTPGLSVTPATFTPGPIQLSHPAFLLDRDRIWILAQWDGIGSPSGMPPLPGPGSGSDPIALYRAKVLALWQSAFGDPLLPRSSRALIKKASLAGYTTSALNAVNLGLAYSGKPGLVR